MVRKFINWIKRLMYGERIEVEDYRQCPLEELVEALFNIEWDAEEQLDDIVFEEEILE